MKDARDQIIETAMRLFSAQSFRGVGVDMIAKESKISKVTMYRYFESKERLVQEVLQRRITIVETALSAAANGTGPGLERLQGIFRWYESWFNEPDFRGCLIIAALNEYKTDPGIIEMAALQRNRLCDLVRQTLALLIHPSVLDQLSRQVVYLLYGAVIFAQIGRKGAAAQDAWECTNQLVTFATQGRAG